MKIVIVGAGFGGLRLARKLNNKPGIEVVLIDRFNHHQFQPLFYQVATAALNGSDISFPLRKVFHNSKNVSVRLAELSQINAADNTVVTSEGNFAYDQLVIATGADTNFFGNSNFEKFAWPMKSTVEAMEIRNHILKNFEAALMEADVLHRQRLLNIVVVGAGPTGVELSGAIAEMKKYVLPKDYPELDFEAMNIYLLEGGLKTLAAMSEKSSLQSKNYLERLGVKVKTNAMMQDYNGKTVFLADGSSIESSMVIWAAGIKGNIPTGIDASLIVRGNRIKVNLQCKVEGTKNIYSIGDVAYMEEPAYPKGHPQVAPVAMQQADLLAKNFIYLNSRKLNKKITEFTYHNKGSMATVGRNLAVVDIPKPKLHLGGLLAWMIWMSLHLMLILGVKNRFFIFLNWLYAYFTRDQNLRLIFKKYY
ncbi:MAG: NAD(P)/FAD-dependent oxidoreductase [Chitinophagaceae bacterium]|jgi:NADH dehydrogenase|nr:NAD(P)/FAD-dependent oxidoreductase [Chitinophagaceae bacterium]MBP6046568.1 NAD(P)/FAD-dependent oxidoreductase [Ferruginibacter sp.]NMD29381.1 NAD(P)/FAD-dependent oxidoreductase [Bacteroidota bacterium]MBK7089766.1 NAD(P)/FAD-dependent oxidoreductase [Chitinophagaceae bacterium]MBK8775366.1 NAD(P)/FAD-dependent oxidoreductase [Chitinophagaceae bacterium]